MGLFKPDFYRFFAFGFVAGAALVLGVMPDAGSTRLAEGIIPAAEAAPVK